MITFELRALVTPEDLAWAEDRLDLVIDAEPGTGEELYREVLACLIETYEAVRFPVPAFCPGDLALEWGFAPEHAERVRQFWQVTLNEFPKVSLPLCQVTECVGAFQMAWRRDVHYFEVDILSSGQLEWFYRNVRSGHYEGSENPVDHIPAYAVAWFKLAVPEVE